MQRILFGTKKQRGSNKKYELKNETVYETLTIIYYLSKAVGLAPFTPKDVSGKQRYVTSLFGSLYSIAFLFCYTAIFVYVNQNHSMMSIDNNYSNSKVADFIDKFQWYATMFLVIAIISAVCIKQKVLIKSINHLADFDEEAVKNGFEIDDSCSKKLILGSLLAQNAIFFFMEMLNCSLFLLEMRISSRLCYVLCYVPLVISGFMKSYFTVIVNLLRGRFKLINSKLNTLKVQRNYDQEIQIFPIIDVTDTEKLLVVLRKFHARLCSIGGTLNEALSFCLFCYIAHGYISFTVNSYFCLETYIKGYVKGETISYSLFATMLWAFFKLMALLHLSLICTKTKNKANKTAVLIHKIKGRYKNPISTEVALFSKQILHCNFKFTALDLFDIDMSVFYLMVTSAATYLIILIQMDLAIQNFSFSNFNVSFEAIDDS